MLPLHSTKGVIIIKLSLREIDLEWGVGWTEQGWRGVKRSEGEEGSVLVNNAGSGA